ASLVAETEAKQSALHEKRIADQQTTEATHQRDVARASTIRTINAIDDFLVKFAAQRLAGPQMDGVRKEMREKALGFYAGLYEESRDDPSLRRETAHVRTKLIALELALGREAEAVDLVEKRVRDLTVQLEREPGDPDLVYELGMAWSDQGLVRYSKRTEAESEAAYREGIACLEKV